MEISNEEKQCNWCGEVKLITEYHKNKFGADGYSPRCATCTSLVAKVVSKTGVNLPDEYITDANKDDIEGAKILLTRIGFDLKQDIYEQFITVMVYEFIRGEVKFDGLDALKNQLHQDKITASAILANYEV